MLGRLVVTVHPCAQCALAISTVDRCRNPANMLDQPSQNRIVQQPLYGSTEWDLNRHWLSLRIERVAEHD
jgi:hypothetical protein